MNTSLFNYKEYRPYLKARMNALGARTGIKTQLANELKIKTSYLSQVFNESAHLSLEQGEVVNSFLKHGEDEGHFFLLMIQRDRSGTHSLKKYFSKQMEQIIEKRAVVKDRIDISQEISKEQKSEYYSSWIYVALHMAVTIPQLRTREALMRHFQLPIETIDTALLFLKRTGLISEKNGALTTGNSLIHLSNKDIEIVKHHSNWRVRAIDAIEKKRPENMNYSGVISVSADDYEKIREIYLETLGRMIDIAKKSKEEKLCVLNADLFQL